MLAGERALTGLWESRVRSLLYLLPSILEWILKPVVTKEQTHGMGELFTSWCPLSLLFCLWHTCCSQSDRYSHRMLRAQSCCVPQLHLLCECCLGELLWTSLALYHCGMREIPETLEKDLQDRKFISASASQQLPVWSGSLSSEE